MFTEFTVGEVGFVGSEPYNLVFRFRGHGFLTWGRVVR
jgi:hypothetical protein